MIKFSLSGLAVLVPLLTSCLDSKNPLSEVERAAPVEELLGVWEKQDKPAIEYAHVGRAGPGFPSGMMRVITCLHGENKVLHKPVGLFIFTTTLNGEHFLNVTIVKEENLAQLEKEGWNTKLVEGYVLVKYQIQGDELLIWPLDQKKKHELITSGKIAGMVDKEKNINLMTAPSEELVKLFTSPDAKELFVKEPILRYKRVVARP